MIVLQEAYRKRPIRFLELWEQSGWQLKVYGIAYQGEYPRAGLIEKARAVYRIIERYVPPFLSRMVALMEEASGSHSV
jgi:hypothetical protein